MARSDIAEADPVAETAQKLAGPVASGITYQAPSWLKIALTAGAANAFAVAKQNPYGEDRVITRAVVRITTSGGTASSVIDVDVVGTATTSGDDIFDGVGATTAAISDSLNSTDNGTNGEGKSWLWEKAGGTNDYLTAQILVANATALVGTLFVESVPAA